MAPDRSLGPPDAEIVEHLDGNLSEDGSKNEHGHERDEGRADGHDRTHDQLPPKPLWVPLLRRLALDVKLKPLHLPRQVLQLGASVLGALRQRIVRLLRRPSLQRRFQVGPVRHASPERPAFRGPLRRFLRAFLINGSPRETASRITAETDVCVASASTSSAAAVAGSTVTRNCFE